MIIHLSELQRNAAKHFAKAMTELTGKPFRASVAQRFTSQRSYHTMQELTYQALSMRECCDRMHREIRDAGEAITAMIGHRWPEEGGDSMLIRTLLQLTRNAEEADEKIGKMLLDAMIETTPRTPRQAPPTVQGVTVVNLSDSSSGDP